MGKRRKYVQPRNARQEDILSIFAEAQRLSGADVVDTDSADGPILSPGLVKCPPWRAINTRGQLGPWYGPTNQSQFDAMLARFRESIYGGGLWDNAEVNQGQFKYSPDLGREDADMVHAWMDKNSGDVPRREMEVYISYFVNRESLGSIARSSCTNRDVIYNLVKALRKRVRRSMDGKGNVQPRTRKPQSLVA